MTPALQYAIRLSRLVRGLPPPAVCAVAGVLAFCPGCASTGSAPINDDGSWPRLTERVVDKDLFLEVVEPEPASVVQQRADLAEWRVEDYPADRKRGMQELPMPEQYRMTLEEFRRNPAQNTTSGPYLVLQLREREEVEGVKEHLMKARDGGQEVKKVKVWRRWRWEPAQVAVGNEPVDVVAIEHEFNPGVFSRYSGTLDADGKVRFNLAPLLRAGASQTKGTTIVLQATCPARKKSVEVRVELEAILHYQQALGDE